MFNKKQLTLRKAQICNNKRRVQTIRKENNVAEMMTLGIEAGSQWT